MERLLPVDSRRSDWLVGLLSRTNLWRSAHMTDQEKPRKEKSASTDGPNYDELAKKGKDVMRGRSFAGTSVAATQRVQTDERQRIADQGGENLDEIGEVTDAEIEAREMRRAEKNED
jgi:hypothetical protein